MLGCSESRQQARRQGGEALRLNGRVEGDPLVAGQDDLVGARVEADPRDHKIAGVGAAEAELAPDRAAIGGKRLRGCPAATGAVIGPSDASTAKFTASEATNNSSNVGK